MTFVERTCTEIAVHRSDDQQGVGSQPLAAWRSRSAYVLLGDPGAGKTCEFEREAMRVGAFYVTARDLITFDDRAEWHQQTLFIDGLDEIRAGSPNSRTPFDTIRARLDKLGCPVFRLSCREADWFGAAEQERLKMVSADGQVAILHLDPLNDADIVAILSHHSRISDAEAFIQEARRKGLDELLLNPQILGMLANAVAGKHWPDTRKQTFKLACQSMIREHNEQHIAAKHSCSTDISQQLKAAGFLCAVQLMAGNAGYALSSAESSNEYPQLSDLAFDDRQLLNEVVRSKLFKSPSDGQIVPIHRHVAEYLAAHYLADRIEHAGLPVRRILALITGDDGIVVSELRGLSAWLAALCTSQRRAIIDGDPLGVVLYGDIQDFSREDKRFVLDRLQKEAARYTWFRSSHWAAPPFGALATEDMQAEFRDILTASDRSETHQALADCVLDAMTYGVRFPSLDDILLNIARDSTWWLGIRGQALIILQSKSDIGPSSAAQLKALLGELNNALVDDPDDGLIGHLLSKLYPQTVTADEVLNYLHAPKRRNYYGSYQRFWNQHLLSQTTDADVSVLLDVLAMRKDTLQPLIDDNQWHDLTTALLLRGLELYGTSIDTARLYQWLGVGLDQHGGYQSGARAHTESIHAWMTKQPAIQKAIVMMGLDRCGEQETLISCMHDVQLRLFYAEPPDYFGLWCL